MDFEFQESDIIFSNDHPQQHEDPLDEMDGNLCVFNFEDLRVPIDGQGNSSSRVRRHNNNKYRKSKKKVTNSPPVDIPEKFLRSPDYSDDSFDDDGYGSGEIVPPHVIVGRRVAGKIASSVCTSDGRMLKGRYICEFRNSILRLTGFLES